MPRKPPKGQSLAEVNPVLAKQWHPTKNGDLTPYDVTKASSAVIWWQCPNGKDHAWETSVYNRRNLSNCYVCLGFDTNETESDVWDKIIYFLEKSYVLQFKYISLDELANLTNNKHNFFKSEDGTYIAGGFYIHHILHLLDKHNFLKGNLELFDNYYRPYTRLRHNGPYGQRVPSAYLSKVRLHIDRSSTAVPFSLSTKNEPEYFHDVSIRLSDLKKDIREIGNIEYMQKKNYKLVICEETEKAFMKFHKAYSKNDKMNFGKFKSFTIDEMIVGKKCSDENVQHELKKVLYKSNIHLNNSLRDKLDFSFSILEIKNITIPQKIKEINSNLDYLFWSIKNVDGFCVDPNVISKYEDVQCVANVVDIEITNLDVIDPLPFDTFKTQLIAFDFKIIIRKDLFKIPKEIKELNQNKFDIISKQEPDQ